MSDDKALEALRAELARQEEENQRRHQALVDKLAEQQAARPMSAASVARTMANGFAQSAAEREAPAGGEDE